MTDQEIADGHYDEAVCNLSTEILEDKDAWFQYVLQLPAPLRIIYTIGILHRQVFNGGFHQYFFNCYGMFAYLTIDSFKAIKAFQSAKLLERALDEVNKEKYTVEQFADKIFNRSLTRIVDFDDDLFDYLNGLDTEYYDLEEDLEKLFAAYIYSGHT